MGIKFEEGMTTTGYDIQVNKSITYSNGKKDPYPRIWGIYSITNLVNGKFYIGSSNDMVRRWRDHCNKMEQKKHGNSHLWGAWHQYGKENIQFKVLEIFNPELETIEENLKSLRNLEWKYIDETKCYDKNIGYNQTIRADSPCTDAYQKLVEGKAKISYAQFQKVIELLLTTELNLREVADESGVKYATVKDIYQKREYTEALKDYKFPVRSNDKRDKLEKLYGEKIMEMYKAGESAAKIAEEINWGISGILRFFRLKGLKFKGQKKSVYIYNNKGEIIASAENTKKMAKILGVEYSTLVNNAQHFGCFKKDGEYLFASYNNIPREMTKGEKALGYYASLKCRPIILYNEQNEPVCVLPQIYGAFATSQADAIKRAIKNQTYYCGYRFVRIEDVPEDDIDRLIKYKKDLCSQIF